MMTEHAPSATDVHEIVDAQLKRARQRYTLGRRQLIDVLLAAGRPVTIPELVEQGALQSQSSLYRNLAILEQCGAVHRIASTDDVTRFELAEELAGHHHHVVCIECGRIDDVILPPRIERALEEAAAEARKQRDFAVDSHRVELFGTCTDCT